MSYDVYTGMLKMYDTFRPTEEEVELCADFSDMELCRLKIRYRLFGIAGEGDILTRAVRVMNWMMAHMCHDGSVSMPDGNLAQKVFDYAFDQPEHGVNCTTLAQTLASCLLSMGIAARPVGLYPFSPYDSDNHFVTECWCTELKQWVMLDPTVNAYVMDADGHPLNCLSLRAALAEQQEIRFSEGMNYNGEPVDEQEQREYLAKNLFFLQFPEVTGYDTSEYRWVYLCPEGYDCKKRDVLNIQWRIQHDGDTRERQKWLEGTKNCPYHWVGAEDAYRCPTTGGPEAFQW